MYTIFMVIHILPITGFILGDIRSLSSPTVLTYRPNQNTTFSCFSRENDLEAGLTFAVNNSVYGIDDLGPFVQFVYQTRTRGDSRLIINTTLDFDGKANGSMLWCVYVEGTQIIWRESFILLCLCHGK